MHAKRTDINDKWKNELLNLCVIKDHVFPWMTKRICQWGRSRGWELEVDCYDESESILVAAEAIAASGSFEDSDDESEHTVEDPRALIVKTRMASGGGTSLILHIKGAMHTEPLVWVSGSTKSLFILCRLLRWRLRVFERCLDQEWVQIDWLHIKFCSQVLETSDPAPFSTSILMLYGEGVA